MFRPGVHPSGEELARFSRGQLRGTAADSVAEHLAVCAECCAAAARVPPDSFIGRVQSARAESVTSASAGSTPLPDQILVPPTPPPEGLPADLIDHPRYRFVRQLGRGGMGTVYLAEHRLMDCQRAIKILEPELVSQPEVLERFYAEVKTAARLDHPHIVRAYDAEQAGRVHLLVMEYVRGASLARWIDRRGRVPVQLACHFARQAAMGLQYAFEQGTVHRDVKPHNLMVTSKGQVKILDFGLAKAASESPSGRRLTQSNVFMGTPGYTAPEQITDARSADVRADVYGLGCTLFALLAGRPPFTGETALEVLLAHLEQDPPLLCSLCPDLPPALEAVVARMLEKDPAHRFRTPADVVLALAPFVPPDPLPEARAVAVYPPIHGTNSPAGPVLVAGPGARPEEGHRAALPLPPLPPPPAEQAPRRERPTARPLIRVVAITAAMLAGLAAAVVVLSFQTAVGTVVVKVNEAGARVEVDAEGASMEYGDEGKLVTVTARQGRMTITVSKPGRLPVSRSVALTRRTLPIEIDLLPAAPAGRPAVSDPDSYARLKPGVWHRMLDDQGQAIQGFAGSFSGSGRELALFRPPSPGRMNDVFIAHRSTVKAPFGKPARLDVVCTDDVETSHGFSRDDLDLYFGFRPQADKEDVGRNTLFRTARASVTSPFGPPSPVRGLPPFHGGCVLSPDARTIYFLQAGAQAGAIKPCLYRGIRKGADDPFTVEATNLEWDDQSVRCDACPVAATNEGTLLFTRLRGDEVWLAGTRTQGPATGYVKPIDLLNVELPPYVADGLKGAWGVSMNVDASVLLTFIDYEARVMPVPPAVRHKILAFLGEPHLPEPPPAAQVQPANPLSREPVSCDGPWRVEGQELVQDATTRPHYLLFGDTSWTDYDYELEAQKTGGMEGFIVPFRARRGTPLQFNVGGGTNPKHLLQHVSNGVLQQPPLTMVFGLEKERQWCRVLIKVRGEDVRAFLNGRLVLQKRQTACEQGAVGLLTHYTAVRFRNIKVTDIDGKVLWQGFPDLDQ